MYVYIQDRKAVGEGEVCVCIQCVCVWKGGVEGGSNILFLTVAETSPYVLCL